MNGAALVCGFGTGMVFTRRVAPLAVAVAGTFTYRALTLWLPMPFALARLPALRRLSKQSLPQPTS
jgi:uncharacterized membrane protein YbhN (UPF0104 family)